MSTQRNITIVGAGNIGLAMTACLSVCENYHVVLYTKKKSLQDAPLHWEDVEKNSTCTTQSFHVTDNPQTAFAHADVIFCTYPAFLRNKFIEECGEYFTAGTMLGFVPGYGGAEFFCREHAVIQTR